MMLRPAYPHGYLATVSGITWFATRTGRNRTLAPAHTHRGSLATPAQRWKQGAELVKKEHVQQHPLGETFDKPHRYCTTGKTCEVRC
jgi:hypothetical protein